MTRRLSVELSVFLIRFVVFDAIKKKALNRRRSRLRLRACGHEFCMKIINGLPISMHFDSDPSFSLHLNKRFPYFILRQYIGACAFILTPKTKTKENDIRLVTILP